MGGIGGTMFLIGAIGTAGTIEQNGNPTVALILTVLGLILMGVSIRMRIKKRYTIILAILIFVCTSYLNAKADEISEPFKVHITCYVDEGITASGEHTRQGICAMKREWIGKTAIVYLRNPDGSIGEIYGIYEIKDCGGTKGLKNGSVVDIWQPSLTIAKAVMKETNGLGYVQIIDNAEG